MNIVAFDKENHEIDFFPLTEGTVTITIEKGDFQILIGSDASSGATYSEEQIITLSFTSLEKINYKSYDIGNKLSVVLI